MTNLPPEHQLAFREAVEAASLRAESLRAVHNLYVAVQDAIDLRRPVCERSGRCCRFDEFGHRLFVTTLEMAGFVQSLAEPPVRQEGGCPYQKGGLCSVHPIRPLGCRIFFCDPTATEWQNDLYERLHQELRRLHQDQRVPYFYVEWRQALACMRVDGTEGL